MLKVSIYMVTVFLHMLQPLSIFMVNHVLLVNDNATKNIIHGSLDMVNIIGHGICIHEHAANPT
jgi:hypothetical protein